MARLRHYERGIKVPPPRYLLEFINPYPWMSDPEAMVYLDLERRQVPFSWRYFDGEALNFQYLFKTDRYDPEFTLKEYKAVIIVLGSFFGTIPAVLDKAALAKVALEADGWDVALLYEDDIRKNVAEAIDRELPKLAHPTILGDPRQPPMGVPDFMEKRREQLRGEALVRKKYLRPNDNQETPEDGRDDSGRARHGNRTRRRIDSGRRRPGRRPHGAES